MKFFSWYEIFIFVLWTWFYGETSSGITKFCRFFQAVVLFNTTSINLLQQWEPNNLKFMEGLGHLSSTGFCFVSLMSIKSVWQLVGPLLRLLLACCHGYLLVSSLIAYDFHEQFSRHQLPSSSWWIR